MGTLSEELKNEQNAKQVLTSQYSMKNLDRKFSTIDNIQNIVSYNFSNLVCKYSLKLHPIVVMRHGILYSHTNKENIQSTKDIIKLL